MWSYAVNWRRKNIRKDTTGWVKGSTENCARNLNLTIRTNGIGTTQHQSLRMTHKNSSGILTYKRSLNLGQMTRPYNNQQKKKNSQNYRLSCPSSPQGNLFLKNEKKDKYI